MTTPPIPRKKQPEKVRRQLMAAAAQLATSRGMASVTVEAVCIAAGVTKGAFFHHFPTKAALIDGVFADLLDRFTQSLALLMAADPEPYGRFSRAYLRAVTTPDTVGSDPLWAALYFAAHADGAVRRAWADWLAGQLAACGEDGDDPALKAVRLAADGLWLAQIDGAVPTVAPVLDYLTALTRRPPAGGGDA